jgi:homoisocitrate dehydrogenase
MAVFRVRDKGTQMTYRICSIEGDGIGHEVIPAAEQVLEATGLSFEFYPGRAGWDCFKSVGASLPAETLALARSCHATLFGANTSPAGRADGYHSPILTLRRELGLYANLRPTQSWPLATSRPGIDLLIVRENTEDLYLGLEESNGETAVAKRIITRSASERIVRLACELALGRRRKLTLVHKANVLRETCGLFRRTGYAVAAEFPELQVDELFVDAMAMRLIKDPETFDVIVTTNLFGDILSEEAAALVGGLGLAPSGNVGGSVAVFEPVHGSAPDIAGRGLANPLAAILSAAMLLDYLHEEVAANRVRQAVQRVLRDGPRTLDLGGSASTEQVTRAVEKLLLAQNYLAA